MSPLPDLDERFADWVDGRLSIADRDRLVVATVGDGSYIFANPVACHHVAKSLELAAQRLRQQGERAFVVVALAGAPPPSGIPGVRCAPAFQHRGRRLHYLDLDVQECRITPLPGSRQRG